MKHLGELKKEATETAICRGHNIIWSSPIHGERTSVQYGECSNCGAGVHINMNPLPNDINIGGVAVAVCCQKQLKGGTKS